MIKIKKRHISEAKKIYLKNKNYYLRGIPFLKKMSEEERIQVFAEMFAECDEKIKQFNKKYPNGFPELKEMKCDIEPLKCNIEEIDWSSSRKWEEEENGK